MGTYKASFIWFLFLSLSLSLLSPKTEAAVSPENQGKSLLWKVSGKGIKTSYLYGTFHLVPKDQFALSSKVKQKLIKSQTVVFEVDLDSPQLSRLLSKTMRMEKPLESLMTAQDYSLLTSFVKDSLERNMQQFRYIKPGFLGQLLLYPKLLGYSPESYDLALLNMAKKWHKSIYVLETPEEQVALFDQSTLEVQTSQLLNNVKQFDKQRKLMRNLLGLYQQEDLQGLYDLIISQEDAQGSNNLLLDERNQKWLAPLQDMMKKSPSFIAVGAAHLAGEQGLIQLLRAQGYKVEPVLD
ncbi:TraB/GumN family protein [Rufibacter glacialis]|uniref:TraB/GumN family protein n=1 Tax=Rufibacter glacialis TaxID=1259555 RepID=A0A5M8QPJ0_9BACT|nr:TraB/GumN family protein [Rufibacter glacialis]KAA6438137.1 TraB/GumN family protein [Rufibacter glacialis]GGK88947.1 lipoprotein [Rufibacter glacialis]